MIILLLINILELLAIVYLLWILFEQVINYEHLDDLHDNALNSLEKIRNERDYWMDEYYSENYKGEIIFDKGEIVIDVIDTTKHPISLYYHAKDCEVIGNIYETPELIKDGE